MTYQFRDVYLKYFQSRILGDVKIVEYGNNYYKLIELKNQNDDYGWLDQTNLYYFSK